MTKDYTIKLINGCTAFASTVMPQSAWPAAPHLRAVYGGWTLECHSTYHYGDDECWLDCLMMGSAASKQHDNVAIVHPLQAPPANNGKKDCHSSLLRLIPFCGSSLFVAHPFLWFILFVVHPFCGSSLLWFIPFVVHPFLWFIPFCGSSLFEVHLLQALDFTRS